MPLTVRKVVGCYPEGMRALLLAAVLVSSAAAQKGAPTAAEIIEKSIAATGGRAASQNLKTTMAKGTMSMPGRGMSSSIEFYAKTPNKRLIATDIEGVGRIRRGFDGEVAWIEDPLRGPVSLDGAELEDARREAEFNAELKWTDIYKKAEVIGKEKLNGRDAWGVRLTPATGAPVTRYYDAETFLLVRQVGRSETPQGPLDVRVDFADYRDAGGGIQAPFMMRQSTPVGEFLIQMTEIRNNVDIDDTVFAKPEK
jgi:outer membrane lipoprotein-sorting protein